MVKVNIDKSLHDRMQKVVASEGYSSVDEFLAHAIEDALKRLETDAAEKQVADQLRGLGYIE